jgi:putative ABC transport system permease protein
MAAAIYRLLLGLYPASFRGEYAREMTGVFLRRYDQQPTAAARAAFWIATLRDVLANAPVIHWDLLRQDLRGAMRTFTRTPGFTVTVTLVAALGIGATTAAFALADHVLIRPLPFPEPDRLVNAWHTQGPRGSMELSPANFRDLRAQSTSFDGFAAYVSGGLFFRDSSGVLMRVDGTTATGDLFEVLKVEPALGRTFTSQDDEPTGPGVIVLSDRLWRNRFGGDRSIVGTTIVPSEGAEPRTIIGVMPPGFEFPDRNAQWWVPAQFKPPDFENRSNYMYNSIARLKPGVSIETARAELSVIADRLAREYPKTNAASGATVRALRDGVSQQSRLLLWGLVAAAAALLLIACTNLASLLLSRSLSRQRELAVRAALGAGRQRLVRQMLTETTVLTGLGGVIGIALAVVAVPYVARLVPTTLPIAETPSLDLRMITAALLATLATAMGVGVVPALRVGRHTDAAVLREGARAGTNRRTERMRALLVVAEIAASIALLVCTGLLVRALIKVQQTDPGFRADGVLTIRTTIPLTRYRDSDARLTFYDRVMAEVRGLPGVVATSYISYLPMVMRGGIWPVSVDGKPEDENAPDRASFRQVMPGFFATMQTPLLRGRDFDEHDGAKSAPVTIVSASFVQQYWPNRDPVGRVLSIGRVQRTVVGVAGDIRVRGLERESEPQVYIPAAQGTSYLGYIPRELVIRTSVPPASVATAVRAAIARVDPQIPIADVRTLREVVDAETAPRRVQVNVLASFAVIAFLLAAIGLHGLLSFNVSSRAREIGVRVALGAQRNTIAGMIAKHALVLAIIGVALGTALAFAAGRAMQALLAGVSPMDPATLAGAIVLAVMMTLGGTLLPTLRALRVDPIAVIRTE